LLLDEREKREEKATKEKTRQKKDNDQTNKKSVHQKIGRSTQPTFLSTLFDFNDEDDDDDFAEIKRRKF